MFFEIDKTRRAGVTIAFALLLALLGSSPAFAQADPYRTELDAGLAHLQEQLQLIEGMVAEQATVAFDLQAVVDSVGTDPAALFNWVASETAFVPYQGALRGPVGVLMDGAGNSLDRALLLDSLLKLAGHSTRMVRATLDEANALQLVDSAQLAPMAKEAEQLPEELVLDFAERFGLSAQAISEAALADAARQQQLAEQAALSTSEQTAALAQLVGTGPAEAAQVNHRKQVAAVSDHWWVQVETDAGWQDLDPSLPGAIPGTPLVQAQQGLVLNSLDQLGGQWLQQIDVRVVIEIWEGGTLREDAPFELTVTPAKQPGQVLLFRQMPVDWPEGFDPFSAPNPLDAIRTTLIEQQSWTPTLIVNGEAVSQRSFSLSGDTEAAATGSNAGAVGGMGGGIGGMFGSFGGAAAGEEEAEAIVTAEWLEFVLRVPGSEPRTVRRPIFDLLGPAVRAQGGPAELELSETQELERALALFGETELLPMAGNIAPEFVDRVLLESLAANMRQAVQLFSLPAGDFDALLEGAKDLREPSRLYGLALARDAWSRQHGEVFLGSANLLAFHRRLSIDADSRLSLREGFDIVINSVDVIGSANPFLARLEQGVLDTNAEAILLAAGAPDNEVVNASLLPLAGAVLLNGSADGAPEEIRELIAADIAAGYQIVLPAAADGTFAWWRIDPESGEALGMGETGWGQAFTEYTEQVNVIMQLQSAIDLYAKMGKCLGLALTNPLRGVEGPDTELRTCVIELICGQIDDALSVPFDIDTNWTNMIVQKTIDESYGKVCETVAKRLA